jgi:hypothetical protein
MSDNIPHWPHDDQDVVNRLGEDHWLPQNYERVNRTPTRAELFSPYIPADILDDGPNDPDPRLREALAYFIHEAEEEAVRQAHGASASDTELTDMDVDYQSDDMSVIELSDDGTEGEHTSLYRRYTILIRTLTY